MNQDLGVVNRFVREVPFIGDKALVILHRATLCGSVMTDYLGNLTAGWWGVHFKSGAANLINFAGLCRLVCARRCVSAVA